MIEQYNDPINQLDIEQIELKEFSRTVSQIEWLLLLLVILYYVAPGTEVSNPRGSGYIISRIRRFQSDFSLCQLQSQPVSLETGCGDLGDDRLHYLGIVEHR